MKIIQVVILCVALFASGIVAQVFSALNFDNRYAMRLDSNFKEGTKWHITSGKASFVPPVTKSTEVKYEIVPPPPPTTDDGYYYAEPSNAYLPVAI